MGDPPLEDCFFLSFFQINKELNDDSCFSASESSMLVILRVNMIRTNLQFSSYSERRRKYLSEKRIYLAPVPYAFFSLSRLECPTVYVGQVYLFGRMARFLARDQVECFG